MVGIEIGVCVARFKKVGETVGALRIEEFADAAVWTLITYLQQGAPDDRIEAAIALGEFGATARAALPALKAAERDEDDDLRVQAAIAMAKTTPAVVPKNNK